MFKSFFTTAYRNLLRRKWFAVINVVGLSTGITACLVIYLVVHFELSFENFQPNKDRIFRIVTDSYSPEHGEDHSGCLPDPAPPIIRNETAGIESLAFFYTWPASVAVKEGSSTVKKAFQSADPTAYGDIVIAEPAYFQVFQYRWLAGNAATALQQPNKVVLTKSKARQYFGDLSPDAIINRTVIYNDSLLMSVAGIVADLPKNSDLFFNDFISYASMSFTPGSWDDWHGNTQVFVKLSKETRAATVNAQLKKIAGAHLKPAPGSSSTFVLQPLGDLHFNSNYHDVYARKAHLPTLYGLLAIAAFILIIAVINFITLATAQSVERAKETGIRKICGSTQTQLMLRFMGETFLVTVLSVLVAVSCIYPVLRLFHSFIPDGVTFSFNQPYIWLFLIGITIITSLLAGLYPAKVLAWANTVNCLKGGSGQTGNRRSVFTKGLVVFQFSLALIFIISTFVVNRQISFLLNKDLGFNKDQVITLQTNFSYPPDQKELLAAKIRQLPGVAMVSTSDGTPIAKDHWNNPFWYKGEPKTGTGGFMEWGDENFVPLYGIPIIAGRNVQASDTAREFLINESCAKALGFAKPEAAVGKYIETISPGGPIRGPIAGVMRDFHAESLYQQVKPVVFSTSKQFSITVNVKLLTSGKGVGMLKNMLGKLEACWKEVYPDDPFNYHFFDDIIAAFYEKEEKMSQLVNYAMIMAISICCLGLFGLSALTIQQRTKEIGIRKVLGAGVAQIAITLSAGTVKLVAIAILIASPIAWYGLQHWLNGFAFRISIGWTIFLLSGTIAIAIALGTISYHVIKAATGNMIQRLKTE